MFAKKCVMWGILLGIALVVGTQILTWMGLGLSLWFVALTYSMVVMFIALGLRDFKRVNGGQLNFSAAFAFVIISILISRLIFQFYMYVYINYLQPDWVNNVADSWTSAMQEQGASEESIAERINTFRQAWTTSRMFTIELVFMAIPQFVLGVITSLYYVFVNDRK